MLRRVDEPDARVGSVVEARRTDLSRRRPRRALEPDWTWRQSRRLRLRRRPDRIAPVPRCRRVAGCDAAGRAQAV